MAHAFELADHSVSQRTVSILGTRGIPAQHGGFETFAERLALHLTRRGWAVSVYCQADGDTATAADRWQGIERIHIPTSLAGAAGTAQFDLRSTWHALRRRPGVVMTLGYNTALLGLLYRVSGLTQLINMDGMEWRRSKWSLPMRAWFYANERLGCWLGDHLVADHPSIAEHLATRVRADKICMIPYGADAIQAAARDPLAPLGLEPDGYVLLVARPEPENSIAEIVQAFSRKPRGLKLVVLGRYDATRHAFHRRVRALAGPEVIFPGAIYEKATLAALRFHCRFYVHGHQVGGTNPSLVEALGAGNAVLAHDNRFNRWVAGGAARYFATPDECAAGFDTLAGDGAELAALRAASRVRHQEAFTWDRVLGEYEELLDRWHSTETEIEPVPLNPR
jgi:glycosyltransferase involved in cell wall biosynthesis